MLFPNNYAVFQDGDLPIHTARSVQSCFEEHEDALQHHVWLAQSPDLNIIKPLVSFREQGEKQIPSIISQATRRRVSLLFLNHAIFIYYTFIYQQNCT